MEVFDIVQEAGIKTIPKKKKGKKAKWLSEEVLQIAVKRKQAKGKGEKEGCTHLNAEFQRIARKDKKAFLGDQCKEIGENNRMGKTRDLFSSPATINPIPSRTDLPLSISASPNIDFLFPKGFSLVIPSQIPPLPAGHCQTVNSLVIFYPNSCLYLDNNKCSRTSLSPFLLVMSLCSMK